MDDIEEKLQRFENSLRDARHYLSVAINTADRRVCQNDYKADRILLDRLKEIDRELHRIKL